MDQVDRTIPGVATTELSNYCDVSRYCLCHVSGPYSGGSHSPPSPLVRVDGSKHGAAAEEENQADACLHGQNAVVKGSGQRRASHFQRKGRLSKAEFGGGSLAQFRWWLGAQWLGLTLGAELPRPARQAHPEEVQEPS